MPAARHGLKPVDGVKHLNTLSALALAALVPFAASAQTYPSKPIRILSTFTPGSVADGAIRLVAQKMADSFGSAVIAEAVSGGGGVLAAQTVVRAPADGHTILHSAPTTIVATPFILKTPPYDPLKDFTFITGLTEATLSMVAATTLPVNNVKELIAYVRANPGKLAYGSNGVGASYHLEMEMLKLKYGLDITHVPYKGGQEGLNAAAAGHIPVAFAPAASAAAQARAGKVKILAIMDTKRYKPLPDVPSLGEQTNDYEKIPTGSNIVGPANMPPQVVKRLHGEFAKALGDREVIDRLEKIGFTPVGSSPEEFAAQIRKDMAVMGKAIKAANVKPE
jgi:tripartite-type tricarboxylate transporter receptor subunit TctC